MRLLAVEDEPALASLLHAALARAGFAVDVTDGVQQAAASLAAADYDAIILDLGLADGDGMSLLRVLRKRGDSVPVLILTARDAPEDRVAGLDGGADDYVIKPFHMQELVSRIRALLRRPNAALGVRLELANLTYDSPTRVTAVDGTTVVPLSLRESSLWKCCCAVRAAWCHARLWNRGCTTSTHRQRRMLSKSWFIVCESACLMPVRSSQFIPCVASATYSPRPNNLREWRLSRRLAWRLAAVMAIAMVLAAGAVVWRTLATIRSLDDAALQSQARLVASQMSIGPDGKPQLDLSGALAAAFHDSDSGSLFVVYDSVGAVVFTSDAQAPAVIAPYRAASVAWIFPRAAERTVP